MARFARDFRHHFPNRVARHFDKYCEYVHPVKFCPVQDVYRNAMPGDVWDSMVHLLEHQ